MAFEGFSPAALQFLVDLAENNSRDWFTANKKIWTTQLLEPAKEFVVALGDALGPVAPNVRAEPRVNGSIFRINRDTRFSKDKTPYKTHLDLWLWEGEDRSWGNSGFFFRMHSDRVTLGAGMHKFDKALRDRYRTAVAGTDGDVLDEVLPALRTAGYAIGGEHYKRVPKPWTADHPRASLLRHDGLSASRDLPLPASVHTPEFVDWCAQQWQPTAPLHAWMVRLTEA